MKLHSDNISDMNPILRAAANGLNRSRSEGQIRMEKQREVQKQKRRQEKEKRRVDALEREKKWMALEKASDRKDDGSAHEESAAEKFQKELCWCIQQLEMGLANMKPNPRQAQEVEKVLRTLKSPKAPLAKKRQVMRTMFGDYRSKMLEEEKKHAAVMANKTNMSTVGQSKLNQATFYRKSSSGSGIHQRSFSSPAGYTPSLSPTKEEAVSVSVITEETSHRGTPTVEGEEGFVQVESAMSPSVDSNKILEEQTGAAAGDVMNEMLSEPCDSDKNREVKQSSPCREEAKSLLHNVDVGLMAASEKDSPTHSVISSLSSDSFNPATTSSSSSHESLLAPSHPASCFRFDFKIEEETEEGRAGAEESFHENQMNKENKITGGVDERTTPSSQEGVSPTIEGVSKDQEVKKKKRKNRKKKKKEQEKLKENSENEGKEQECDDKDNKETDVKHSPGSQIELSLGGGEFKFDFGSKVDSS